MMIRSKRSNALTATDLTFVAAIENLPFRESGEMEPFTGALGHHRALQAIDFALGMERPGYNLFISGSPGTGRLTLARQCLEVKAQGAAPASDSLYLPNFTNPKSPRALQLPAGLGRRLIQDVEIVIDRVLAEFGAAIESPAYQRAKAQVENTFTARYRGLLNELSEHANRLGVYLVTESEEISFAPLLGDSPATEDEFADFPEDEKASFSKNVRQLEAVVLERLMVVPHWRRENRDEIARINRETISAIVQPAMQVFGEGFCEVTVLGSYLDEMTTHLENVLLEELSTEKPGDAADESLRASKIAVDCLPRLLVGHDLEEGRPVVFESNPTLRNLFGYVESVTEQGTVVTRHSLIYPGSIHRANGGYLIVEAGKIVAEPQVWPALKRALVNRTVRIESPTQDLGLISAVSLDPEELPLQIKVVLVGSRELFYLLQELDTEFIEVFRVLCDFDEDLPRTAETEMNLLRLIHTRTHREGLSSFTGEAGLVLLRYASRLAEDRSRLSLQIAGLIELVAGADHERRRGLAETIERSHVEQAILTQKSRSSRLSEQVLAEILEGSLLIETDGSAVGRVNGLTVIDIGNYQFGNPARISATVYPGSRGVVDIEREVELGEAIHSKGVMILAGYLGQRYARDLRMAFSANLALEQSYGRVDGDSASLAELCALISALAELPLKQGLAVTGSINQYGQVQPVGGVNEKIEGFFELCRARGLSGKQGVIIPKPNIRNLVLDEAVVESVRKGVFNIWAVATVDEAVKLLTGTTKRFTEQRVMDRIKELSALSDRSDM